jgi:transcriptional regulator with XRE-family HTH domain
MDRDTEIYNTHIIIWLGCGISMVISAAQIRAARALIGWTQAQLAAESGLSEISIQKIEKGITDPRASTLAAIERALAAACVEFTNGDAPGVRLLKGAQNELRPTVSNIWHVAERDESKHALANLGAEYRARTKRHDAGVVLLATIHGIEYSIGRIEIANDSIQFTPPYGRPRRDRADGWLTASEFRNWTADVLNGLKGR